MQNEFKVIDEFKTKPDKNGKYVSTQVGCDGTYHAIVVTEYQISYDNNGRELGWSKSPQVLVSKMIGSCSCEIFKISEKETKKISDDLKKLKMLKRGVCPNCGTNDLGYNADHCYNCSAVWYYQDCPECKNEKTIPYINDDNIWMNYCPKCKNNWR